MKARDAKLEGLKSIRRMVIDDGSQLPNEAYINDRALIYLGYACWFYGCCILAKMQLFCVSGLSDDSGRSEEK